MISITTRWEVNDKFCILSFKYDAVYRSLVEEHHDFLIRFVEWILDERILG